MTRAERVLAAADKATGEFMERFLAHVPIKPSEELRIVLRTAFRGGFVEGYALCDSEVHYE